MKKWPKQLYWYVKRHRVGVALIAILVLTVLFRLWRIWDLPPGLHPDEAANGLDIFRIQDGDLRVLYNTNGPRESLFFFLQAIFVLAFGNTIWALRLAPALIGIAAVGVTYLWAKEWFSKRTALIAAFIMASEPWAVTLTRDGYRASMVPLMIALTVWLFSKSYKERKWYWHILTGLSLGAGFYTYLSFRLVPLVMLLVGGFCLWQYRKQLLSYLLPLILIGIVTAATLVPLGLYTLQHKDDVLGGRSSVSITNPELNKGSVVKTFGENILKTALMFNFSGDENYRHNLGGAPMMNAFVGVMFVLGGMLALRRFMDIRYFVLLSIFAIMLVPMILTAEGIPHALRSIGVLPAIYILAAIGVTELMARWHKIFPRNPAAYDAFLIALLVVLALSTFYNYRRYFVAWANAPQTFEAYSEDAVAIGEYLKSNNFEGKRAVAIDGFSDKTVAYLTHDKTEYTRLDGRDVLTVNEEPRLQLIIADSQSGAAEPHLANMSMKTVHTEISKNRAGVILFRVYEKAAQ